MNRAETTDLLSIAAAYDYRKVGESDVVAWTQALTTVMYDDAAAAVVQHYSVSTDRLMPAHVRRLAVARANARHDDLKAITGTNNRGEQLVPIPDNFRAMYERSRAANAGTYPRKGNLEPLDAVRPVTSSDAHTEEAS